MAQTRTGDRDLSNTGFRRVGLTRDSKFQGPHAHQFNAPDFKRRDVKTVKQKDVDIDAPPEDSSEEEKAPLFEADEYGEASDSTDSDFHRKPRSSPQDSILPSNAPPNRPHSDSRSSKDQNSQKNQYSNSDRKRKVEQMSDNETAMNMSFQVAGKGRQKRTAGYGRSRPKPQEKRISGPAEGKGRREPISEGGPLSTKEGVSAFIQPPTDDLLAELEKQALHQVSSKSSSPSSKSRLPNKRSKPLQEDLFRRPTPSQPEQPLFKAPQLSGQTMENLSTKRSFKRNQERPEKATSTRNHRYQRELKPMSSSSSKMNIGPSSDSAIIAAQKLGLEEVTFKSPASLPSVSSPTDKTYLSGGFSSPPTSLNDDASSIGVKTSLVDDFRDSFFKTESAPTTPHQPKCPMCKATVDSLFLEGFTMNRRLSVREQAKFCQAHQRRTADEEWKAKGYPTIDWSCLHMQVKIHSEAIGEILKGDRFSYYRNAYDDLLRREKHKTLQQSLIQGCGIEDFSPGYYGSRGARIMIDNLMSKFASKLRRQSSSDHLISARGVTNFVRAVLVPELATLLVMDDMMIDAEAARKVLRESVELGNLLNEEQDEVIKDPDMENSS